MTKQLITWVREWTTPRYAKDPTLENWEGIFSLQETGYCGRQKGDSRLIGVIDAADFVEEKHWERLIHEKSQHGFVRKTIEEANLLLVEWYGEDMVIINEDFTITNNIPKPEGLI